MTNDQIGAVNAAIDSLRTLGRRADADAVVALLRAHNRLASLATREG